MSREEEIPQLELAPHPFEKALEQLINRYSMESESDTPDFILARYMFTCLSAYQNAIKSRVKWYGSTVLPTTNLNR